MIEDWKSEEIFEDPEFQLPREDESGEEITDEVYKYMYIKVKYKDKKIIYSKISYNNIMLIV